MILRGYARHATHDQGMWLIRNYFNFGTRSFAFNSFLVDYDPDFVRAAAEQQADPALLGVAVESLTWVERAALPNGLLHQVIQPEIATLYPDLLGFVLFSPNDVIQLANTCVVAERALKGPSRAGRQFLQFL